eukprot:jgi/Hompol1/498/HPOL_005331-RA
MPQLEIVKFIADLHWEFLQSPKPYREAEIYVEFNKAIVETLLTPRQVKIPANATYLIALQTLMSGNLRRLPVVASHAKAQRDKEADGSAQNGANPSIIHIVTETEIVKIIHENLHKLDTSVLGVRVGDLAHLRHLQGKSETDLFRVSVSGKRITI